jgi:uncharacterized membrane protein YqaE (UPF0057 family)
MLRAVLLGNARISSWDTARCVRCCYALLASVPGILHAACGAVTQWPYQFPGTARRCCYALLASVPGDCTLCAVLLRNDRISSRGMHAACGAVTKCSHQFLGYCTLRAVLLRTARISSWDTARCVRCCYALLASIPGSACCVRFCYPMLASVPGILHAACSAVTHCSHQFLGTARCGAVTQRPYQFPDIRDRSSWKLGMLVRRYLYGYVEC